MRERSFPAASYFSLAVIAVGFALPASMTHAAPNKGDFQGRTADSWAKDLRSTNAETRRTAAYALGKCGAAADPHLDQLREALKDQDHRVREAAAQAFGERAAAAHELRQDCNTPDAVIEGLADLLVRDAEPAVRRSAARALGLLRHESETAWSGLVAALRDRVPSVRQNAAWAIGEIKPEKPDSAVPDLVRLLADDEPMVRRDAALALGHVKASSDDAVSGLAKLLDDPEDPVRHNAVDALAMIGPKAKRATATLVRIIAKPPADAELLKKAMVAASAIGGPELKTVMRQLRETLRYSDDPDLRQAAASAFVNMGKDAMAALVELQWTVEKEPVREIRQTAALAFMALAPELRDTKSGKDVAIWMLKIIADTEYDVVVRQYLVQAFLGSPVPTLKGIDPQRDGVDPLKVLLKAALDNPGNASRVLRYEAARVAVVEFGPEARSVTPILVENLEDPDLTIIRSTGATTTTTGGEGGQVGGGVDIKASGDGRILPAEALGMLGRAAPSEGPEAEKWADDAKAALEAAAKDPKSKELREAATKALRNY